MKSNKSPGNEARRVWCCSRFMSSNCLLQKLFKGPMETSVQPWMVSGGGQAKCELGHHLAS